MGKFDIMAQFGEVPAFLKSAKGPVILYVSDTPTDIYPALQHFIDMVRPAMIIHTGDCADEYKVGRKLEDRPGYEAGLKALLRILGSADCPVVLTPGNNDDFSQIREPFVTVVPNGTVAEYFGVRFQLDHYPYYAAAQVEFALSGHTGRFDLHYPPEHNVEGPVYINGDFHWALIDSATKQYLRIPCATQMPVTRIFATRHGQVATGEFLNMDPNLPKADPPLSPTGVVQAVLLAQELQRLNFRGKIFASPFRRTLMTAQIVAERLHLPLYPCMAIREVMKVRNSLGNFEGMTLAQMRENFSQISEDAQLPYPWWDADFLERQEDVEARVSPFMDTLLDAGEDVLLVGHGASLNAIQSYLLEKAHISFADPAPRRYNCALSLFRCAPRNITPMLFNSVSHLPTDKVTWNYKQAAPKYEQKETWYLAQMHLHAGFENFASIRSHAVQAKRLGYDALYITEHDTRMNRMPKCIEEFTVGAAGEASSLDGKAGWYWPDGSFARSIADGDGFSLYLQDGENAAFSSNGKRHQASLLSDLTVTLQVKLPAETAMTVDFTLSQRPDDLCQQHLIYGIGDVTGDGWFLKKERQEEGMYTFRLSEDALYFDPAFGLDNAFLSVSVKAEGGELLVRSLKTERKWVAEEVRTRQAALAKSISQAYGIQVYSGFESSVGHHRNCFSAHAAVRNYEESGYGLSNEQVEAYLRSYNATFAYNHMFQEWKRMDGLDRQAVMQQLVDTGEKTRFGGAQLLEVGFPQGKCGFSMEEHLQVWDKLAMRGVRMVGYGDSDSHDSRTGWTTGNRFGSWIMARENTASALEQAMRQGRVCFGDPVRWHGSWEFTADAAQIGDTLTADQTEVKIRLWDLAEPVCLRVVCGGETLEQVWIGDAEWSGAFQVSRGARVCCPVRLEVCDSDGKYLFLTNPIYLTDGTIR